LPLTIGASTYEGICDRIAKAQVVLLIDLGPRIVVSWRERRDIERWGRDETTRLEGARQTKKTTHSPHCMLKAGTLRLRTDFGL
jgi:hypothetical protein